MPEVDYFGRYVAFWAMTRTGHSADADLQQAIMRALAIVAAVMLCGCVERDTYACKAEAIKAYPDPYCKPLRESETCPVNWDWLYGERKNYVSECMAGKGWLQKTKKGCGFVSDDPDCFEADWWHNVQAWLRRD